eukprot:8649050-Karenia_brevis.AAC.1
MQHLREKHVSGEKQDSVANVSALPGCAYVAQHNFQEAYEDGKKQHMTYNQIMVSSQSQSKQNF